MWVEWRHFCSFHSSRSKAGPYQYIFQRCSSRATLEALPRIFELHLPQNHNSPLGVVLLFITERQKKVGDTDICKQADTDKAKSNPYGLQWRHVAGASHALFFLHHLVRRGKPLVGSWVYVFAQEKTGPKKFITWCAQKQLFFAAFSRKKEGSDDALVPSQLQDFCEKVRWD